MNSYAKAIYFGRRENGQPIFEIVEICGDDPKIGDAFCTSNSELECAARELVAWVSSGNSVNVELLDKLPSKVVADLENLRKLLKELP